MLVVIFPTKAFDYQRVNRAAESIDCVVASKPQLARESSLHEEVFKYISDLSERLHARDFAIIGCDKKGYEAPWILDAVQKDEALDPAETAMNLIENLMFEAGSSYVFFLKDADQLRTEIKYRCYSKGHMAKDLIRNRNLVDQKFVNPKWIRVDWGDNLICEVR